jgi:hypothetical protein
MPTPDDNHRRTTEATRKDENRQARKTLTNPRRGEKMGIQQAKTEHRNRNTWLRQEEARQAQLVKNPCSSNNAASYLFLLATPFLYGFMP